MYFSVLKAVFSNFRYLLIALAVSVLVFSFAVWLPNIPLIAKVLTYDSASVLDKLSFVLSLYGSIATNFTVVSALYTLLIALLFGIQVALLVYYICRVRGGIDKVHKAGTVGLGGLISGVLGIGCTACGTFILTSVLVLFGATGFLAVLPFGGEEFGFLGVALLGYSVMLLVKKISDPLTCPINY